MTTASPPASSRICRLCLTGKGPLFRIFGGGIVDLAEKIYDITAIEIDDISEITSLICELCRSQILVSHQFVLQCRVSDWKYKKLLGTSPPVRKDDSGFRSSTGSTSSGIGDLTGDSGQSPKIPTKTINPVKHDAVRRLKNHDGQQQRRDSIDLIRNKFTKKRLISDSSQNDVPATVKLETDLEGMDNRKKHCPHCGLLVIHLEKHIENIHTDAPKHICRICKKTFKHRQNLVCHVNNHNGIRPYKCKHCDKSYSYQNSLYDHMKSHQDRYFCSICHEGFTHAKILKNHVLTHQAKK